MTTIEIIEPFNKEACFQNKRQLCVMDLKFTEPRTDDGMSYEYCEFRYDTRYRIGFDDHGDHGYYHLIDTKRSERIVDGTDSVEELVNHIPDMYTVVRKWSEGEYNEYEDRTSFAKYEDAVAYLQDEFKLAKEGKLSGVEFCVEDVDGWTWDSNEPEDYHSVKLDSDENYYIEWNIECGFIHHGPYDKH